MLDEVPHSNGYPDIALILKSPSSSLNKTNQTSSPIYHTISYYNIRLGFVFLYRRIYLVILVKRCFASLGL